MDVEIGQTTSKTPEGLPRRPSVLPKRARRACSFLGLPFLAALSIGVAYISWRVYARFEDPHVHAYWNREGDPNATMVEALVVRPLIGKKGELGGEFDIIATVWIKEKPDPDTEERPWEYLAAEWHRRSTIPIFSKTVFEGVSLQDKHLRTEIDLQIPVHYLNRDLPWEEDLRASFVLVPRSPSFLDYANSTLSKANMDNLKLLPVRSYPSGYSQTLQDEIVDSYGISVNLLKYSRIESRCNTTRGADSAVLNRHPYIITRTFIRVVDTTKVYELDLFDVQHEALKWNKLSCQMAPIDDPGCRRDYETHGNFETKFDYVIPVLDSAGQLVPYERLGWAYGPFMSSAKTASGPMDLVPLPVNFEYCPPEQDGTSNLLVEDEPFVNITWNIGFSGRTPSKLFFGDALIHTIQSSAEAKEQPKSGTELLLIFQQYYHETAQRFIGHLCRDDFRKVGTHMTLLMIAAILPYVELLLTTHYYNSLKTTMGLSHQGIRLVAFATLLNTILSPVIDEVLREEMFSQQEWTALAWNVFSYSFMIHAMLETALDVEFRWTKNGLLKVIPVVTRVLPTPAERASRRREKKFRWSWRVLIFCTAAIVCNYLSTYDVYVTSPHNSCHLTCGKTTIYKFLEIIETVIVEPCFVLGFLLQLAHNYHSKMFAGAYRSAIWVSLLTKLSEWTAWHVTLIVGSPLVAPGFTLWQAIVCVAQVAQLVQSYMYPAVPQDLNIDHEVRQGMEGEKGS